MEKMENVSDFNEFMLKQTAITFSLEGVSKDLKSYLQKKISHNRVNITQVTEMIAALSHSPSKTLRDGALKKGSQLNTLLTHVTDEVRFTDMALNLIIQSIMAKEALLSAETSTVKDLQQEGPV